MSTYSRLRDRNDRDTGDQGSAMLLVMLAIIVVGSLSVLALGTVIGQMQPTTFQRKALSTINGAESGLDAGLAAIRSSLSEQGGVTLGDRTLLPCWTDHPGSGGSANGADVRFRTTIRYYSVDPADQTEAWRSSNALSCGAYGPPLTPGYALIQSKGSIAGDDATQGNRSMETLYTFKRTDKNISGGLIRTQNNLCYAATSGSPVAGSGVTVRTCAPGTPEQLWAYTSDYLLQLTSTQTATAGVSGMCINAAPGSTSVSTVDVTMQPCNASANEQRWGVSDSQTMFGHLTGVFGSPTSSNSWCLNPSPDAVGGVLRATQYACPQVLPEPQVGSGGAGTATSSLTEVSDVPLQWVNYREFGRCVDITNWVTSSAPYPDGRPSEISYPCKQDPLRTSVAEAKTGWNQVFTWNPTTGRFWADVRSSPAPWDGSGDRYCMQSPAPGATTAYVSFSSLCLADSSFSWTVRRETGVDATRYSIIDGYGRCLAVGPPNMDYPVWTGLQPFSAVIVAACNGGAAQKWNAPPGIGEAPTKNTQEIKDH